MMATKIIARSTTKEKFVEDCKEKVSCLCWPNVFHRYEITSQAAYSGCDGTHALLTLMKTKNTNSFSNLILIRVAMLSCRKIIYL